MCLQACIILLVRRGKTAQIACKTNGVEECTHKHAEFTHRASTAGVLSGELGSSLGGAAIVMSCGAAGVACGLPLWLMPAPLLAGSGIALFYDSGSIRDYCLFSAGTFATGLWFLHHHYWFLNVQIQTHGLRFLCQVILAALLPATLLPGLIIGQGNKSVVRLLMLGQVCTLPSSIHDQCAAAYATITSVHMM